MPNPKTTNHKPKNAGNVSVEARLGRELKRLQQIYKLGLELSEVRWIPDGDPKADGRVADNIIYIYERDPEKALEVLKHEVLDHALTTKIISPLTDLVNLLVKDKAEKVYREKEKLIKCLTKLF